MRYDWPGNVRELRNQLRRAVLVSDPKDELIRPELFGIFDLGENASTANSRTLPLSGGCESDCPIPGGVATCQLVQAPLNMTMVHTPPLKEIVHEAAANIERIVLTRALELTCGNKAEAARLLHVDYKTIQSKFNTYGITFNKTRKKRDDPKDSGS